METDVKPGVVLMGIRMLTLSETARELNLSIHTLRQNPAWPKRLGAVKVGGKWLVPADSILDVLTGRR